MFNNIGKKIKVLAEVICWIGIIASIITAIWMFGQRTYYSNMDTEGALLLIFGPLSSWIGSWMLYAFGQLVENTDHINRKMK